MKDLLRKTIAVALTLMIVIGTIAIGGNSFFDLLGIESSALVNLTRSQAVSWARNLEGDYIDVDGLRGYQCADLVTAYMNYLWLTVNGKSDSPFGTYPYTTYYAYEYDNQFSSNSNWTIITRNSSTVPQPGDIFVSEGPVGDPGHVGIILQANGSTGAEIIHQNRDGSGTQPAIIQTVTWTQHSSYYAEHFIRFNYFSAEDTTKPTISNVKVTNQTANGYTVSCTVSDNVGVANVQFPTWTTANGMDDVIWYETAPSGNTASYTIKRSSHNNEAGEYQTNIYAFDAAGNIASYKTIKVLIDTTKPAASITSTNTVTASQTATLKLTDNINLAGYYWGTNSSYSKNTYATVSGTSKSVTKTVSSAGTYYLTAKDASGNISSTVSKTFYKTAMNANSGSVSPASVITMSGNSFKLPTPTRSGYTFTGWNTKSNGTGTGYAAGASYKPTGNVTLYAQWKESTKPIASITSTNTVTASQTATLKLTDNVNLAGYYWGTNSSYSKNTYATVSGTSKSVTKTVSAAGTYYLTAKDAAGNISSTVSKTFYKTTLNANSGSVSPASVITLSGNSFKLPTPTRSGYTFTGWNTKSDGTGTSYAAGASYKPTGNATLYAQWKDSTKPTASITSTNNLAASQTATLTLSDNSGLAGYYWGTSSTYSDNTYETVSGTSKSVTKTISAAGTYYLTAKDAAGNISSTVSKTFYKTELNANGGSVTPTSVITLSGYSFALPTPARSEYEFINWNTESNGTGTEYNAGDLYKPTGNVTLYAQWNKIDTSAPEVLVTSTNDVASIQTVTITMSDNEGLAGYYWGEGDNTQNTYTMLSGKTAEANIIVSTEGTYYLTVLDGAGQSTTKSITFHETKLYPQGGTVSPETVLSSEASKKTTYTESSLGMFPETETKIGSDFMLPLPERAGYIFKGWNTESDGTGKTYEAGELFHCYKYYEKTSSTSGGLSFLALTESETELYAQWEEIHVHSFNEKVVEPTCTEIGCTVKTCSCGYYELTDYRPPLDHCFTNYVYNNDATTEADGTETAKCDRCDVTDTRTAEGTKLHTHSYSTEVTAPTCTEQGFTTYTCECGDSYVDDYVPELSHSFTNYVYNNDATTEADGTETAKCDLCEETDTRTAEGTKLHTHSYATVIIAPSCTEQGYTTYTCECGDSYKDDYVPELGHTFTNYVYNNDATTDADGTETAKCDLCEETDTRTAEGTKLHTHLYSTTVTAPTCTEQGFTTYTCECGDSYKDDYVPELGHSFTNYVYNNDATTEADGTETARCVRCDKTDTRKKPGTKLPNSSDTPVVNPTANAKLNVAGATTLNYRTKLTIKATASNLDPAYHLVLVVNGKEIAGNNKEVVYEYGEIKNDVNYSVKIVDESGNIQKDADGAELKKDGGEITCNDGFFRKLIAFFQGLFKMLPKTTVQP